MNLILIKCFSIYLYQAQLLKSYYDELMQRAVSKFIPADDLVVPYTATSLDDCESIIHVIRMSENELRKNKWVGFIETSSLCQHT